MSDQQPEDPTTTLATNEAVPEHHNATEPVVVEPEAA